MLSTVIKRQQSEDKIQNTSNSKNVETNKTIDFADKNITKTARYSGVFEQEVSFRKFLFIETAALGTFE